MDSHYWPLATHCCGTLPSPPRTGPATLLLSLSKVEVLGRNIPLVRPGHVLISQLPGRQARFHPFSSVGKSWPFFPRPFAGQNFHSIKETFFCRVPRFPSTFHSLSCLQGFTYTLPLFPLPLLQANPLHSFLFWASPDISCVTQDLSLWHANS